MLEGYKECLECGRLYRDYLERCPNFSHLIPIDKMDIKSMDEEILKTMNKEESRECKIED